MSNSICVLICPYMCPCMCPCVLICVLVQAGKRADRGCHKRSSSCQTPKHREQPRQGWERTRYCKGLCKSRKSKAGRGSSCSVGTGVLKRRHTYQDTHKDAYRDARTRLLVFCRHRCPHVCPYMCPYMYRLCVLVCVLPDVSLYV